MGLDTAAYLSDDRKDDIAREEALVPFKGKKPETLEERLGRGASRRGKIVSIPNLDDFPCPRGLFTENRESEIRKAKRKEVCHFLSYLSFTERKVLVSLFVHDKTFEEVALARAKSVKDVKACARRAMETLCKLKELQSMPQLKM